VNEQAEGIRTFRLNDDGRFPNHPHWPLLLYTKVLSLSRNDPAGNVERIFHQNGWGGSWRNGIYSFHHYHSNTHEVLGMSSGSARVQFGGPEGIELGLHAGDVAVLPAGTVHRNLESSEDFGVVGAYPKGAAYDMCYGKAEERSRAMKKIASTSKPDTDPVFGKQGGLLEYWRQTQEDG
jgi:uncharacterized protein YjlB